MVALILVSQRDKVYCLIVYHLILPMYILNKNLVLNICYIEALDLLNSINYSFAQVFHFGFMASMVFTNCNVSGMFIYTVFFLLYC